MPQHNDALCSGGGDRHLWLTALPDNQILTHPSPATLLNLRKSDHERWAVYHPGSVYLLWVGKREQERQRAASPVKCCLGSGSLPELDADACRADCGALIGTPRLGPRGRDLPRGSASVGLGDRPRRYVPRCRTASDSDSICGKVCIRMSKSGALHGNKPHTPHM